MRLLARFLVRAYLADRKLDGKNPLDCLGDSNPSCRAMTDEEGREG